MNSKHYLQNQIKSKGVGYIALFFTFHYIYLGKTGTQILFWITICGLGIWWLIDLFRINNMIDDYNSSIFEELEKIEKKEKDEEHAKNMAMVNAVNNKKDD